ncbi:hypothetical protein BSKO_11967 [Bryopsis sp. KO-2023]|nr:hypothetical protein BSKO_11967 [Bryopsis sp. KO-2023]
MSIAFFNVASNLFSRGTVPWQTFSRTYLSLSKKQVKTSGTWYWYERRHPKKVTRFRSVNNRISIWHRIGSQGVFWDVLPPPRHQLKYQTIKNRALTRQRKDPKFIPRRLSMVGQDDVLVHRLSAQGLGENRMSELGGLISIEKRFFAELGRQQKIAERAAIHGRRGTNALLNMYYMLYKDKVLKGRDPEILDDGE